MFICKVTNLLFLPLFYDRQNKEFSLFFILLQQILDIKSAGGKYLEQPKRLSMELFLFLSWHRNTAKTTPICAYQGGRGWRLQKLMERYTNHQNLFADVSKCYYMFEYIPSKNGFLKHIA